MRALRSFRTLSVTSILLTAGVLSAAAPARAAYPGPNGRIAFMSTESGSLQIWSMRSDGTVRKRLTDFAPSFVADPDTSPDGTRIAFDSDVTGDPELYAMNADGTGVAQITHDPNAADFGPRYSPDGTTILFARCKSNCNLYVMNADGTGGMTKLTSDPWDEASGSYSPDGTKIVFDSNRKGLESAIWTMNADGSNMRRLTPPDLEAFFPDWSPDGERIVFSDNCCVAHSSVWIMNADGTSRTKLITPPGEHNDAFAVFSPRGDKILFDSDVNYNEVPGQDLFTMNTDGSGLTRISTNLIPNGCDCVPIADWGSKP
jgi:Tol biopolymer transport system component